MRRDLLEAWNIIHPFLTFVGGATVVRFVVWLFTRRRETFDNSVQEKFMRDPQQPVRNAEGVWSDFLFRLVPGCAVIFPFRD
jgi:hypothetical protein